MFMLTQRVEVDEADEIVISMTSEVVTVDLAAVAEEADSEETVTVLLAETGSADSVERTETVGLGAKHMLRLSDTARLHTENLAEKTSFKFY